MWTVFVAVSWWLTTVESQEEIVEARQVALLCDRYNELGRPPITGTVRNELIELLPPDWEPADVTETAQTCATD